MKGERYNGRRGKGRGEDCRRVVVCGGAAVMWQSGGVWRGDGVCKGDGNVMAW